MNITYTKSYRVKIETTYIFETHSTFHMIWKGWNFPIPPRPPLSPLHWFNFRFNFIPHRESLLKVNPRPFCEWRRGFSIMSLRPIRSCKLLFCYREEEEWGWEGRWRVSGPFDRHTGKTLRKFKRGWGLVDSANCIKKEELHNKRAECLTRKAYPSIVCAYTEKHIFLSNKVRCLSGAFECRE